METITRTMTIRGMNCSHCTASVEKALSRLFGVDSVDVSLSEGVAVIKLSYAVSDADLREAVVKLGFVVEGIV